MSLEDACRQAGIDGGKLLEELASQSEIEESKPEPDANEPRPDDIDSFVEYLVERHHAYARDILSILGPLLEKICRVHGGNHPELESICALFSRLERDLKEHFAEEEQVWFPHMRRLARRHPIISKHACCGPQTEDSPERAVTEEHLAIAGLLQAIRREAGGFVVPPDGCGTFRRTYQLLRDLEQDLHRHIHLENNVLLPVVKAMEETRARAAATASSNRPKKE